MTYCVGIMLDAGLVLASDSRTHAGVDNFASFCKMSVFERAGDRVFVLLSSGNLAGTQAVIGLLKQRSAREGVPNLWSAESMFDAALLVSDAMRDVDRRDGKHLAGGGGSFNASFILGGQISGTEDLYKIYAESFQGSEHLQRILVEAQATVDTALALPSTPATPSPNIAIAIGYATVRRTAALPPAAPAEPLSPADEAMLDGLQRAAFDYFVRHSNRDNGLVADTSRPGSHASIAVVGFALSAYPVGVERGWMTRAEALQRSLAALRFFRDSDQSGKPESTGRNGFYFHFLHLDRGTRAWRCELSLIDTALLLAGMLTAAAYFTAATADEAELRELADMLYRRVDWCWAQRKGAAVVHGWKPKSGFLNYGWEGYSEALLLYTLGLGSPTHPLTEASFPAWTSTYQWENLYGIDFLYAGPLFIHQFSHAWIDFRGIRDDFMREKHCDYFENSRRATYVQREYAIRNPRGFVGYGEDGWGLSAGDGPRAPRQRIAGRRQSFYGYAARGVPYGPDDGTLSGPSVLASLVFAPEIALPAIRRMLAHGSATNDRAAPQGRHTLQTSNFKLQTSEDRVARASGFNDTVREAWISEGTFGLDQGLIVLMIENFRSGLLWRLLRGSAPIRAGLQRAGFRGGWLAEDGHR